jgi:ferredoxin/chitodextrinase
MKNILYFSLLILILAGCVDNTELEQTADVRVEFSDCISCRECVDDFSCPQSAILIDPETGKAYIDADRCVQCMDCIDEFSCETDAFTTAVDDTPPAEISDLVATSEETGTLKITFTAVGDDGTRGQAYRYELSILDSQNQPLSHTFTVPRPQITGEQELWTIEDLPENEQVRIELDVLDEISNRPETVSAELEIMGMIEDLTPPAAIDDLQAANATTSSVMLSFTAVGDDQHEGVASSYTIKYQTEMIDAESWDAALEFPQTIVPQAAGESESIQVTGLLEDTEYYFAVKAVDDNQNISSLSNLANITTESEADLVAPAPITDLQATAGLDQVELFWTAVGDNEQQGTALYYEIRISEAEITADNWQQAELLENLPDPAVAGSAESYLVSQLAANTTYYFAIKAFDASGNSSPLEPSLQVTTLEDDMAPAPITDFAVREGLTVVHGRIKVEWTAPGDNGTSGTAASYEVRYSTSEINESNWQDATVVSSGVPDPAAAGTEQNFNINFLEDATIYYFAIKTTDAAGNTSEISNCPAGKIVYQINEDSCYDCGNCINDCDEDAIIDVGPYKTIDPDLCIACGDCSCPYGLIKLWVVGY